MVEKYNHNKYTEQHFNEKILLYFLIKNTNAYMCILRSPLNNYYLKGPLQQMFNKKNVFKICVTVDLYVLK